MLGALLFVPLFCALARRRRRVPAPSVSTFRSIRSSTRAHSRRAHPRQAAGKADRRAALRARLCGGDRLRVEGDDDAPSAPPHDHRRRARTADVAHPPLFDARELSQVPIDDADFIYMNGERVLFGEAPHGTRRRSAAHPRGAENIDQARRDPRVATRSAGARSRREPTSAGRSTAPVAACDRATPASNLAAPNRLPLLEMRAVGSSTAVAIGTLWSGLDAHRRVAFRDRAAPLGLRARGRLRAPRIGRAKDLMFGNARLFVEDLPVSHEVEMVLGSIRWPIFSSMRAGRLAHDARLLDRRRAWKPYFAVDITRTSTSHASSDPDAAPFQPSDMQYEEPGDQRAKSSTRTVYLSDRAVARLIEAFADPAPRDRTVIFFMSDHGELPRARPGNNHSGSVYDEEIRVLAWVDPPSVISPRRANVARTRALTSRADERGNHPSRSDGHPRRDTGPLCGRDDQPFARRRRPPRGHRAAHEDVCWAWNPNWGVMRGPACKVEARSHGHGYPLARSRRGSVRAGRSRRNLLPPTSSAQPNDTVHMLPKELGRLATNPAWGSGGRRGDAVSFVERHAGLDVFAVALIVRLIRTSGSTAAPARFLGHARLPRAREEMLDRPLGTIASHDVLSRAGPRLRLRDHARFRARRRAGHRQRVRARQRALPLSFHATTAKYVFPGSSAAGARRRRSPRSICRGSTGAVSFISEMPLAVAIDLELNRASVRRRGARTMGVHPWHRDGAQRDVPPANPHRRFSFLIRSSSFRKPRTPRLAGRTA